MESFEHLLQQNPSQAPITADQVIAALRELKQLTDERLQPVIERFQQLLDHLTGHQFNELEANKRVASAIQELLNHLHRRVCCTRPGCTEPSLLSWRAARGTRYGTFEIRHSRKEVRTTHAASTTLPQLSITHSIPDPRRGQNELS